MKAFAFLGAGTTSYLTGLRWPPPGDWVERSDDAVRACTADQLSWWLDDELWEVELDGAVQHVGRALTAPRARLSRRIDGWADTTALELVRVCAQRVRDRAAELLAATGRAGDATALAAADEPDAIEAVGMRIADEPGEASVFAGLAADVVLYARDARAPSRAAGVAAFVAAFALAGGDKAAPGYETRFEAERQWQAAWLKERLQL